LKKKSKIKFKRIIKKEQLMIAAIKKRRKENLKTNNHKIIKNKVK